LEQNTLIILYPGCIEFEIMLAAELMNRKFPVKCATPDGKPHIGSNGIKIIPDYSFNEINVELLRTILIPGGDPGSLLGNCDIDEILKMANSKKVVLGAICAGPFLLEKAGLMDSKRMAHGYGQSQLTFLKNKGYFKHSILTDDMLVIEENIVTAKPNAFIDFAVTVALCSGAIQSLDEAEQLKKYYKGK